MTDSSQGLSLYENFIEAIAQVLSKALSNEDTEKVIKSFSSLQERLRQISRHSRLILGITWQRVRMTNPKNDFVNTTILARKTAYARFYGHF